MLFVFMFYFCVLTPYVILATTSEEKAEIHAHFEEIGEICLKENPLSAEDQVNLRDQKVPSGPNAPCFLACMMKRIGLMDASGVLKKDPALEKAKKVFDEEEIRKLEENLRSCSDVNNQVVSDGEKGCERAMLAFKCLSAKEFEIDV